MNEPGAVAATADPEADATSIPRGRAFWSGAWHHLPDAISAFAILASFVGYYLVTDRHLWFFEDDWDFIAQRQLGSHTMDALFTPHNEHWSTVPIVIYRVLFSLFGVRHFLPYLLPALLAHVGICIVVWALLARSGISKWLVCVGVVIVAINGGGAQNLYWAFQIGFLGAVLSALLAVLVLDIECRPGRTRTIVAVVLCVLGLMFSGVGLVGLAVVAVYVLVRHGWILTARVAVPPLIIYIVWYVAYGHAGVDNTGVDAATRLKSASYFWTGVSNIWSVNTGISGAGFVLLAAMVLPVLVVGLRTRLRFLALSGLAGLVLMYLLAAVIRVDFGVTQSVASRYIYIGTVLTVPALLFSVERLFALGTRVGGTIQMTVAGVLVFLLLIAGLLGAAQEQYDHMAGMTNPARDRVVGVTQILRSGQNVVVSPVDNEANLALSTEFIAQHLSDFPNLRLTSEDLLQVRLQTQVGISASLTPLTQGLGAPKSVAVGSAKVAGTGCTITNARAGQHIKVVAPKPGARVQVSAPGSQMRLTLKYRSNTSSAIDVPWTSGQAQWIAVSAPRATLLMTLEATGPVIVCLPT